MKIAIHKEGDSFTARWIAYCDENGIGYKIVNCYADDIIKQLQDCDGLLWHHSHMRPKDALIARQIIYSLELSGKAVFPNYKTTWHFDDKLGQKYLLEAAGLPGVKSYAFFSKKDALNWVNETTFPKVFKLRGGSGSSNVRLVKTKPEAIDVIDKAFGKGFSNYQSVTNLKERYRKYRLGKATLFDVAKGAARLLYPTQAAQVKGRERGYAYFQEFIAGNDFDIRVVVIANKAFAIKRMVRKNDFRASGGGDLIYDQKEIPLSAVQLAFKANEVLKTQCIAFDIVFDKGNPLIIEISYGFSAKGYDACPGYWNKDMQWVNGAFNPYGWMIDTLIASIDKEKTSAIHE